MKAVLFILLVLFRINLLAEELKQTVDILPLQIQFRYEDSVEQAKATQQYQSLGFNYQRSLLRFGYEVSSRLDKTGNQSLSIEKKVQDYLLTGGYQLYQIKSEDQKLSISWFAETFVGQTQTDVKTTLFSSSTTSSSEKDWILGLGSSLVGRYSYALLVTDIKVLSSKNMSPQIVPALSFKFGFGFSF